MKKLLLVVKHEQEMLRFQNTLENYFLGTIHIEAICEDTVVPGVIYSTDVLLTYSDLVHAPVCRSVRYESYIPLTVTLTRSTYPAIMQIPKDELLVLLDDDEDSARQITVLIHQLFRGDLRFLSLNNCRTAPTALAFRGDDWFIPMMEDTRTDLVLLDEKVIDRSSLLDIIHRLDMDADLYRGKDMIHARRTFPAVNSFNSLFQEHTRSEDRMSMIFDHMTNGAITFCRHGIVFDCSAKVQSILHMSREELLRCNVTQLLPLSLNELVNGQVSEKVIEFDGSDYILTIIPADSEKDRYGLLMMNNFDVEQRRFIRHRKVIVEKRNTAKYDLQDLVGTSQRLAICKRTALQIAKSDGAALLLGESGTGKELFAHIIHRHSPRRDGPFLAVNCAAFSPSLLESELFGYESGAFTGAAKGGKAGLFEAAHNGTVFLDEIGEMPVQLQTRLLRVLQEHEVIRVGGHNTTDVDVRIIAATNQDLHRAVAEGRFRKDLYYRLSVLPLYIPPLRDRREDIPELFRFFMEQRQVEFALSPALRSFFLTYSWPGNIRELRNLVEYFSVLGKSVVGTEDLPCSCAPVPVPIPEEPMPVPQPATQGQTETALAILLDHYRNGYRIGRVEFAKQMTQRGYFMGEQQARAILKKLEQQGLVTILRGRGGTVLTEAGLLRATSADVLV